MLVFTESNENYLKAILILKKQKGLVRRVDVANYTGFSKPCISRSVRLLQEHGYVQPGYGYLELTRDGWRLAESLLEKYTFFSRILIECGVDPEVAGNEACAMEHAVSDESFGLMKKKLESRRAETSECYLEVWK